MTNVLQEPNTQQKSHSFGRRLKSAREAQGMDSKDAAGHLRVHEKIILMIESGIFNNSLPLTFIRGYIRSYAKLLEIPEPEVREALDLLQPKIDLTEESDHSKSSSYRVMRSTDTHPLFMTLFTLLILVTLISLVAIWWHSHKGIRPQINVTSDKIGYIDHLIPAISASSLHKGTISTAVNAGIENIRFPSRFVESRTSINDIQKRTALTSPSTNETLHQDSMPNRSDSLSPRHSFINLSFLKNALFSIKNPFSYFSRDKQVVIQAIVGNYNLHLLIKFILLLFILNLGLRQYRQRSLIYIMTGNRPTIRTTPKPFRPLMVDNQVTKKYKLAKKLILIIGFSIIMSFSYMHWKHYPSRSAILPSSAVVAIKKEPIIEDNLFLHSKLENFAPSSNLNAKLRGTFKLYPVQSMLDQLDRYIVQAASIQAALTHPNTDIEPFFSPHRKKKPRHRHQRVVVRSYNDNIDPYHDTE
jgi:cytoskeletal protein RodZ